MSLVLPTSRGKSHLLNLIDTPGHVNFIDEVAACARLADGVLLVVDVVEGVMSNTEAVIRMALQERMPIVLVLNKMDRLILELRLPPSEAFFKIKHTIEEVNTVIAWVAGGHGRLRAGDWTLTHAIQRHQPGRVAPGRTRARQRRIRINPDRVVLHPRLVCADVRRDLWCVCPPSLRSSCLA